MTQWDEDNVFAVWIWDEIMSCPILDISGKVLLVILQRLKEPISTQEVGWTPYEAV